MKSNVVEAVEVMRQSLENFNASETERIGSPSLGDVVRQGDVYLVNIKDLPKGKAEKNRQLAPGNTQGSRHIVEGNCQIIKPDGFTSPITNERVPNVLVGPAFQCMGDCEVTHPEHGNKILPEGTTWQVVYQQAYAEEIRRVQD